MLSNLVNKNKPVRKNSPLKIGDKVVNLKNNYSDGIDNMIANGDIGYLREVAYDHTTKETSVLVEFDDGIHNVESLSRIEQAMALTVHKVQGSSFKVVIAYIGKSHEFFLSRNLMYVCVTRATDKLILIGDKDAIESGCKVQQNLLRNTGLKEMLLG